MLRVGATNESYSYFVKQYFITILKRLLQLYVIGEKPQQLYLYEASVFGVCKYIRRNIENSGHSKEGHTKQFSQNEELRTHDNNDTNSFMQ